MAEQQLKIIMFNGTEFCTEVLVTQEYTYVQRDHVLAKHFKVSNFQYFLILFPHFPLQEYKFCW